MPDEPWTPRRALGAGSSISPSQFAHFVVRTPDLDGSATWYQAVLSARIVFRNNLLCFMTYDDEHHRIAFLHVDPEDSEVGTGAIDHVAYSFSDLGALLANYMRLRRSKRSTGACAGCRPGRSTMPIICATAATG
jgi:catechol-2,3-dioxygenase